MVNLLKKLKKPDSLLEKTSKRLFDVILLLLFISSVINTVRIKKIIFSKTTAPKNLNPVPKKNRGERIVLMLTSLGKELRIDGLECLLINHPTGTLLLKKGRKKHIYKNNSVYTTKPSQHRDVRF